VKKIPPNFRWKDIKPILPLQERIRLLMDRIHRGVSYHPYADATTVNECIKRGLIKRGRRHHHATWAHSVLIPLVPAPEQGIPRVPKPFAKRIAAMNEAGLRYRGKGANHG
jgi:hypothetical protein